MKINVEEFLDEIKEFYFHENEVRSKEQEVELENQIWRSNLSTIDSIGEYEWNSNLWVNKLKITL